MTKFKEEEGGGSSIGTRLEKQRKSRANQKQGRVMKIPVQPSGNKMTSKALTLVGIPSENPLNSKSKAEVFQTEREKFLKDFEKPTQIYRYMRTRMLHSPVFLYRNLTYMRNRMKRTRMISKELKVDDLLEKAHKRRILEDEQKSVINQSLTKNFLNVIVLGFSDGQQWVTDTEAKVDIQIVRICMKKRKESKLPVSKVFCETCSIKIRSPSNESVYKNEFSIPISKGKYPAINIPKDCFNLVNGHIVQSIRLLVRVTIPSSGLISVKSEFSRDQQNTNDPPTNDTDEKLGKGNSRSNGANRLSSTGSSLVNSRKNGVNSTSNNNNSSSDLEEPKQKRQRSLPTKDRENFIYENQQKSTSRSNNGNLSSQLDNIVYVGMVTIYDKDNNLNIPAQGNSDLEFRLDRQDSKKPRIPARKINKERTWDSIEENNPKVKDYLFRNGTTSCAAKLALAIRASDSKLGSMVDPPAPVHVLENGLQNEDERIDRDENVRVLYQFVHTNNGRQVTESRNDLRCPWCSINCLVLYSLLKHLKICHSRFHFNFAPIVNGARVDITLNESYDGSYTGSAYDLVAQPPGQSFARNGPGKRTQVFNMLVFRPPPLKRSLQEFFESDEKDAEQRRSYVTGHNRLYHHTTTCLPIHPREIDVDSEGEPDPEWLKVKTCMMIDEFTDVNEGEKDIMKMWNHHVMHDNYVGDCQIPLACKKFVERYGKEVIQKNLYRNFILHLTNLFDFGLLPAVGFHATVQLLHSQMKDNNTASSLRDSWISLISSNSYSLNNGSPPVESMDIDTSTQGLNNGTIATINGHSS